MFILETLNFVVDILKVPAILVGLIALIGLVAQKNLFQMLLKVQLKLFSALLYWAVVLLFWLVR